MRAPKAQLRAVLASLVAILVLGAAKCPGQKGVTKPGVARKSAIPDSADQIIYGLHVVMTDQGVSKGVLLSDTAFSYDDGTRLDMRRVNMTFNTAQGIKDGVLTSRTGLYNTRLSRLEARGDVVIVREDGRRLTSPQLVYDQARNQIFTDSAFVLTQPGRQQFTGIGFESDPRLNNFRCLRTCKGVAPVQVPTK